MTPAERQQLKRDRRKAGLVRIEAWVPVKAESAVRKAIAKAIEAHKPPALQSPETSA